jgi:hypothetical protein
MSSRPLISGSGTHRTVARLHGGNLTCGVLKQVQHDKMINC